MNKNRGIKLATIAVAMIAIPLQARPAPADKPATPTAAVETGKPAPSSHHLLLEKKKQLVKEAAEAVEDTRQALVALENGDPKLALADLEVVSGKLHEVLAKDPTLKEVPIDADVEIREFAGNLEDVQATVKQARDWLASQRVQDARRVLEDLSSEIRVSVVQIPLETFPAAIEKSAALIVGGKTDEAEAALDGVLHTLSTTTEIYPLPLLAAEEMLSEAFRLEHTTDLKKEESSKKVSELADKTAQQLKLAETLGYGTQENYRLLYDGIAALKQTVHTERFQATWDKLKASVAELRSKLTRAGGK